MIVSENNDNIEEIGDLAAEEEVNDQNRKMPGLSNVVISNGTSLPNQGNFGPSQNPDLAR